MNAVVHPLESLSKEQKALLKSYHAGLDGDGEPVSRFRYLPGSPRQYRFNGQIGRFYIGEAQDNGTTMSFQPLAFRIFSENLFNRGRVDEWAEILFVDPKDNVSVIMFNNTSVGRLMKIVEELYYDGLSLTDVVLTVKAEKKENDKGRYFAAVFEYTPADPATTKILAEFAADVPLYRVDTMTRTAITRLKSPSFFVPEFPAVDPHLLPVETTEVTPQ